MQLKSKTQTDNDNSRGGNTEKSAGAQEVVSDALVLTAEPQVVQVPAGDSPGLQSTGFSLQIEERDELDALHHHKGHLKVGPDHSEKPAFISWQGTLSGDFLATK